MRLQQGILTASSVFMERIKLIASRVDSVTLKSMCSYKIVNVTEMLQLKSYLCATINIKKRKLIIYIQECTRYAINKVIIL